MHLADEERRLTRLFRALGEEDRRTLLAFAAFLAAGQRGAAAGSAELPPMPGGEPEGEPKALPRPGQESVIAAIRRLTLSYGMLDRGPMLHDTAALMSAHVLQGRDAARVIDDLEALFQRHYQQHRRQARTRLDPGAVSPDGNSNDGD